MMASVLFSTIGQAVGGPLGAGVGLAVGAGVDSALLRGGGRGARDGYAQGSAYGEPVPLLFGTNRVAGQVIWALPAEDGASRKGGGRQARTASLAIALSSGAIREVRRIWADGRLFRDSDGLFEQPVQMRVHDGRGSGPDPLVAATEGLETAPAFQSLAYVVFEALPLEPFGNRIPSFSFEVVADQDRSGVWLERLARESGLAGSAGQAPSDVQGYAAYAMSAEEDLSALARVADAHPALEDGQVRLGGDGRQFAIEADCWLAPEARDSEGALRWVADRPAAVEVGYLDAARDYQLGQQRTVGTRKGRGLRFSWQLSATASEALRLSARVLRTAEAQADRLTLSLPLRWLEMAVGDRLHLPTGEPYRVVGREVRGAAIQFEAERLARPDGATEREADPGRAVPSLLERVPATRLTVIEPVVPFAGEAPGLLLVGSGAEGWRGAEVGLLQGGEVQALGHLQPGGASGWLLEPLGPGPETIWDERNAVLVAVDQGSFPARTRLDVLAGGGLIHVGGELLQYRDAALLSERTVRLTGLLRRRRATGPEDAAHPAGTALVLVGPSVPRLDMTADEIGRTLVLLAGGRGDPPGGTSLETRFAGAGLAPLAPVHLRGRRLPGGAIACWWHSRSREGWPWQETASALPVPSQSWLFRRDDGAQFRMTVAGNELQLTAAEQAARFGAVLPAGMFAVEVSGDGPLQVRRSRWVAI